MKTLIISLKIFFFFTLLTGVAYPLLITGTGSLLFPSKANGSLIFRNGLPVGSKLIGQESDTEIYFSPRPSASRYNTMPSAATNYGLTNSKLRMSAEENRKHFITHNHLDTLTVIPPEMIFASASGLDPDIPVRAAWLQVDRIALARHFTDAQKQKLTELVKNEAVHPVAGIPGEEYVNVLLLNLALDNIR